MKKNILISIIFSCFLIIAGWVFINSSINQLTNTYIKENISITVKGAVYNKLQTQVEKGTKVKEVIFRAHLLLSSDISKLNIEKILMKDEEIYVPYKEGKEPKIDTRDGLSRAEIDQLDVSKNLGNALFKLFKENHNHVTWEEIDQLPGTGKVTMAKLRRLLIIHQ